MPRQVTLLSIALLALSLPGCPFESHVAVGSPQKREIDGRLTGDWVWEGPEGKSKPTLVSILAFSDSEYLVELQEPNKRPGRFRAYQVDIDGELFWNVNEVGASFPSASFMLARHAVTEDGQLSLLFVGDKGVPEELANDEGGLRAYLASHRTDPLLNDKDGPYLWRRPRPDELVKGGLRVWSEGPN